ncbi:MAG: hypothetical protein Q9169_002664 [Polycauliona sp. 2 TL-2023]
MVYVAVGFVIVSLCSFCYAYKHLLWATIWPHSKQVHTLPEINVGAADGRHPKEPSPDDGNRAATSQSKDDTAKADEMTALSARGETGQHPQPAQSSSQQDRPVDAGSSHSVKPINALRPDIASNVVGSKPNASMPPPARPGPRLRPKATKPSTPSSISQPRNNNTNSLGVPQTASSSLRPLPTGGASSLQPPPSLASSLRAPPSRSPTTPSSSLAPTSSTLPSSARPSKKVQLSPGHSPLDWAHLTSHPPSPNFLRGADVPPSLIRVPPSLLKHHNGRKGKDAWGVWQGKVYNLTPYMEFHPGGVNELMKGAGREKDGERLFLEVHPWVNWENMLGECLVGILVGEEEVVAEREGGGLEDMD